MGLLKGNNAPYDTFLFRSAARPIVHDDDVARLKCRHQELLDPSGKDLPVYRPIENAGCIDPVMPKRRDEGEGAPFAEGRPRHQLLAAPAPAPDRRHVRLGPSLVDENESLDRKSTRLNSSH